MSTLAPAGAPVATGPGPSSTRSRRAPAAGRRPRSDPDRSMVEIGTLLELGAAVGLATMAVTLTGDALAAGVLLGLAVADVACGAAGVLVGVAVIGRWGSSSLVALAGGQAVLGAAGWSGPTAMRLSSWAAAVAVVFACCRRRSEQVTSPPGEAGPAKSRSSSLPAVAAVAAVVAGGIFAAALVAGPGVGTDAGRVVAQRVAASAVGVVAAALVFRLCPRQVARIVALAAATAAAALAVLA